MTFQCRTREREDEAEGYLDAGVGGMWLEIRKREAGLSHPPPWAQQIGPGANT